jgi:hypothetical protein
VIDEAIAAESSLCWSALKNGLSAALALCSFCVSPISRRNSLRMFSTL